MDVDGDGGTGFERPAALHRFLPRVERLAFAQAGPLGEPQLPPRHVLVGDDRFVRLVLFRGMERRAGAFLDPDGKHFPGCPRPIPDGKRPVNLSEGIQGEIEPPESPQTEPHGREGPDREDVHRQQKPMPPATGNEQKDPPPLGFPRGADPPCFPAPDFHGLNPGSVPLIPAGVCPLRGTPLATLLNINVIEPSG